MGCRLLLPEIERCFTGVSLRDPCISCSLGPALEIEEAEEEGAGPETERARMIEREEDLALRIRGTISREDQ